MAHSRMEEMMRNPIIVAFGRQHVLEYPIQEYIDSFRRAFVDGRADFINLDSCITGQKFLAASVAWAIDEGWLYCSDVSGWPEQPDAQSTSWSFRLTDKGRLELKKVA